MSNSRTIQTHFTRRNFVKSAVSGMILSQSGIITSQALAQNSTSVTAYAPELRVPYWIDADGKKTSPFTLAANKNKYIFLKCFQNWCPGCHSSGFPTLQKLVKTFGTNHEKITFAAIQTTFEGHYTNNKSALRSLQLRYDTPIPYGHDEGDPDVSRSDPKHYPNTMHDYRTRGTPWLIIISPERQVVFSDFHINVDALIDHLQKEFA
ncbi:MAG: TlpA family protein disulfide reductase [Arenicella sp.]